MKNPGCANNRGSPLYASANLSYQILLPPKAPAAIMMTHSPRPACVQISTFLHDCRHPRFCPLPGNLGAESSGGRIQAHFSYPFETK
jgi:hypothetical protein